MPSFPFMKVIFSTMSENVIYFISSQVVLDFTVVTSLASHVVAAVGWVVAMEVTRGVSEQERMSTHFKNE